MGFRTVVVLNNDRAHEWKNDPELGRKIFLAASVKNFDLGDHYQRPLPYGEVVEQVHADLQSLVVCDGYSGRVAAQSRWCHGDTDEAAELRLLQKLAEKHGFNLHKKPQKKA